MRRALFRPLVLAFVVTAPLSAQTSSDASPPLYMGSDRVAARVATSVLYQHVEDEDVALQQLVVPVSAFVPLSRDLGLSLNAYYASSEGEEMTSVAGVADAQLGLSYQVVVGAGTAVANLGLNMPAGGSTLTRDEAATAFLIGQSFYGFRLPSLGQGFNVAPGVTYAIPVGERLAVGVGASYQHRGAFEPREGVDASYDPGGEVLFTGGLDYQVSEGAALALDVTYVQYGADAWAGQSYQSGDAVAVTGQWAQTVGPHELRLLGRVRQKADGTVPPGVFVGIDATVPTQGRALALARLRLGRGVAVTLTGQGRYYAASEAFTEKRLADLRAAPELRVAPGVVLTGQIGATLGDLRGLSAGGGLSWSF